MHYCDDFILNLIQPVMSAAGAAGELGGGWKGVRRWCEHVKERGGLKEIGAEREGITGLIVHVDADIAGDIEVNVEMPCPPPLDTVERVEETLKTWLGLPNTPQNLVFCIPSKATEAWFIAGYHPATNNIECLPDPAGFFVGKKPKFVKGSARKKEAKVYKSERQNICAQWPSIVGACESAERFDRSLRNLLHA
jgi:hypothetical protein